MEISEIIHFKNPDAFPARNKTVSLFNFARSSTSLYLSTPSSVSVLYCAASLDESFTQMEETQILDAVSL